MITEIRLRNFKCFAALDLPLAPLTLLTGVNNTGKSSVLQALLLLRQSYAAAAIQRGGLALNGDLVRLGSADMAVREEESRFEIGLDWDDHTTVAFAYELKTKQATSVLESVVLPQVQDYQDRCPFARCRYVSADRTGPRAAFPTSEALVVGANDVGPRGEFTAHYLAEHGGKPQVIDLRHHAGARGPNLRYEVEAWLELLSADVEIRAELQAALDVCGLAFTFPGSAGRTKPHRSTHVGFGLTYVLPILVVLLSAKPGDLVMIENPEAHLHPRAQRDIADLCARAAATGVQVLVETHSDHVLNGTRIAVKKGTLKPKDLRVHFFKTTEPRVLSPEVDSSGAIHEWPEGFFDEWDRALDELLKG